MKTSRLIATLVTGSLLGLTPTALAAPAQATENLTTVTTLEVAYGEPTVEYGETVAIRGSVQATNGVTTTSAYYGTVTLYAASSKNPAWVPIATATAGGYVSFPDVKPESNTSYKAVYSGYAATNTAQNNYAPSESAPLSVGVQRKVTYKIASRKLIVSGKVTPEFSKKKILVHTAKKNNGNWKKYKTIKTNKKGKFKVRFYAKTGQTLYFLLTVKGDAHYTGWSQAYYTTRY